MFSKKVINNFLNPDNAGGLHKASTSYKIIDEINGIIIKIYLKIDSVTGVITEAHFKTFGCPVSIACSNVACELIKNKTYQQAKKISNADIISMLDEVPMEKIYCATIAEQAIKKSIEKYEEELNKNK